ncbi:MAG: hypothetical protein H6R02_2849 [Burkholderiaceae bacterium]|nr:hypothetical protein [Burkholderiaceae bacterium]
MEPNTGQPDSARLNAIGCCKNVDTGGAAGAVKTVSRRGAPAANFGIRARLVNDCVVPWMWPIQSSAVRAASSEAMNSSAANQSSNSCPGVQPPRSAR